MTERLKIIVKMLEQLSKWDTTLFLYLNHLGTNTWDGFWMWMTQTYSGVPIFFLLMWYTFRKFGWKSMLIILFSTIILVGLSDQLANLFKNILVRRPRPCYSDISDQVRLVKSHCGGTYGYFSAHASTSFAIAMFFGYIFYRNARWLAILTFIWAALSSYSRIYIGVHYPLDTITGIIFGIGIGSGIYFLIRRIWPRQYFGQLSKY